MENPTYLAKRIYEGIHDLCYIWVKEMKSTFQDEGVLIFFILVPLAYPILYGWIYKNQFVREVPVAVVDYSHSEASRTFVRLYDASPDTRVAYRCTNIDEARNLMAKQVVSGAMVIPPDFQTRMVRHEQATVALYCDMSIMLYYKALYQTAMLVAKNMSETIQIEQSHNFTNKENELTLQPMRVSEVPMFNPTGGYADFILPGVLILILHQTLLLGIGLAAGTARENNRYQQLIPISKHFNGTFRVVMGKALSYFTIYCVVAAYVLLVVPRIFSTIQLAQPGTLIAFGIPFLLSTIFFAMVLSCVIRYRENVILLTVFTTIPLLFLSGISWPLSNIPGYLQSIAWLFPSTFGIRAFVRINSMGANINDVQPEYIALWIQTLVYFVATCFIYRYQLARAIEQADSKIEKLKQKAAAAAKKQK